MRSGELIYLFSIFFELLIFFLATYYFLISLFSFAKKKNLPKHEKINSYAIIIAAHNEENVISELIKSIKKTNYPEDKLDIFVVSDNSKDLTTYIASKNGAKVFNRFNLQNQGKGFAVDFAFKKILNFEKNYDFFAVFDADNIVHRDFFININKQVNNGYRAVQGYIESKNPFDSLISLSCSTWYWINNRALQLSRHNLNMGCQLGGTGFVVEKKLIEEIGWNSYSMAEDSEFTLKLANKNIYVGYAYDALVYDEKPCKINTSIKQRMRWAKGIFNSSFDFFTLLIKKSVKEKNFAPFNTLLTFFSPSLFPILYALIAIFDIKALKDVSFSKKLCLNIWALPVNFVFLNIIIFGEIFVVFYGLYKDKKINKHTAKGIFGYIFYIITWVPIAIVGAFNFKNKKWFHTPHKTSQEFRNENVK